MSNITSPIPSTLNATLAAGADQDVAAGEDKGTLRIASALQNVTFYIKDGKEAWNSPKRWSGYLKELSEELARRMGYRSYELYDAFQNKTGADKHDYGTFDRSTNKWKGLVREVMDGRADIIVADLTVTPERANVVQFSYPILDTISNVRALQRLAQPEEDFFGFINPFHYSLWLVFVVALIFTGVMVYITSVMSYDTSGLKEKMIDSMEAERAISESAFKGSMSSLVTNKSNGNGNSSVSSNQEPVTMKQRIGQVMKGLGESCWNMYAVASTQGPSVEVGDLGSRMIIGAWYLTILVLVSSYTANLAAFLTVTKMAGELETVWDIPRARLPTFIAKDSLIDQTINAIEIDSQDLPAELKTMILANEVEIIDKDRIEGQDLFNRDKYVYVTYSLDAMKYVTLVPNSRIVPGIVYREMFGIAADKSNDKMMGEVNFALTQMRDFLSELDSKYFAILTGGASADGDAASSDEVIQLEVAPVAGIFIIMAVASIIGLLMTGLRRCVVVRNLQTKRLSLAFLAQRTARGDSKNGSSVSQMPAIVRVPNGVNNYEYWAKVDATTDNGDNGVNDNA